MGRIATISNFWNELDYFPNFPLALCKNKSKPLWDFQTDDKEKIVVRGRRHNKAIKICKMCPHKAECLSWGVSNEMQGVWGGAVLVPGGRAYLRCDTCDRAMIKSRYQKPPRGFRNRYTDAECVSCAGVRIRRQERLSRKKEAA